MAAITNAASAVVARPVFVGKTQSLRARAVAPAAPKRASVVTFASAEETSRRAALSTFTVSACSPNQSRVAFETHTLSRLCWRTRA
jgi:photosystem II oxygen-evolving enhancer protein 2/Niemann-Pick C1 protein